MPALSRWSVPASRPSGPPSNWVFIVTLSKWIRQDDIDRGVRPGVPSSESAEMRAARRRIRELEQELTIVRHAAKFLGEDTPAPKGCTR